MSFIGNFVITISLFLNVCSSCVFQDGKYDLSSLNWPGGWPVPGPKINGTSTYYEISICHPLNYTSPSLSQGCPKSSVCQISGERAVSFGKAIETPSDYEIFDNGDTVFSLNVLTEELCDSSRVYQATINFTCGPNLGAPELILWNDCQVTFFWRTSAACINKPKIYQVPCYVIDNEGNKRDLSHLILRKGAYSVSVGYLETFSFTINVCSEISDDESCGSKSSACWHKHFSFGKPHERLQYTQEGLILSYLTGEIYSKPPRGCSLKPKTTVVFKCPVRNHSDLPWLVSTLNCQYKVMWYTEYACPENLLKGSLETCQFTKESHGVEIDLRPLKRKPVVNIPSSLGNSTFALSVCGGFKNFICSGKNRKSTSVCAIEPTNSSSIIGTTEGSHLIYADGVVTLTYPGRESCDNDTYHSSVIKFLCDSKATNNGDGQPYHISSDHCIHTFEWKTKHVCLEPSFESTVLKRRDYCSVHFQNRDIKLKKLFLKKGKAWEAIDQRNVDHKENAKYYMNVCGQVSYLDNLNSCGPGSSVCVLYSNGKYLNLGNFTSPPIYNIFSDSARLTYTGGSLCKDKKQWMSTIDFICCSGHINAKPILVYIDESECQYRFEWHTSEACPRGLIKGVNCKIYDYNLGINYDLAPFKNKIYEIESELYKFYISVCEVFSSAYQITPDLAENTDISQEGKINSSSWKFEISDLMYLNGIITSEYYLSAPVHVGVKIVYICDFSAGSGSPHFVKHDRYTYIFHWYTDLVCSNSSNECMVQDPFSHLIYDLSLLSTYDNSWVHIANKDNKEIGIYLSVCRPLAEPLICDSNAAACLVEKVGEDEKAVISNLGQAVSLPVLEGPGHLILKYTNGNICTAYGENVTYSTTIHFLCAKDKMGKSNLQYLSKVDTCEYAFLWTTKAACPIGIVQSFESCQLTDPDSGFTFDLTPLWKDNEPYTVKTDFNTTFQLNICGRVVSGCLSSGGKQPSKLVSVCQADSKGKSIRNIAVSNSYILSYLAGRDLSISYKPSGSEGYQQEVIIKFPCYKRTADLHPKFIIDDKENRQLIFEMKTSLTCIPSHFDCSVIDQYGNEYDLNPLAKYRKGNWEVTDSRPTYSHLRYHINFCRPLKNVTAYMCPTGSSGACVTNTLQNASIGHDLGSQINEPFVNDKGIIVLHYTHGSYCRNGRFRRSAIVNLFCSGEQEDLKFIGETPECEYIFSLATPVACPIQNSVGRACTVKEPFSGYIFDLNPLKSENNYNVTVDEYSFYFSVCDKLNGFQNVCINSSACQMKPKDPSFSKSLGLPNDQLVYRNGLIILKYTSDTNYCDEKCCHSTEITFTCHHGFEEIGPYFISEARDCTFLFEWPTVHVCPPFDIIQCSVIDDNGTYYDLSLLSLYNDNYYVKHPMYEKQFVINVCSSVVHTPHTVCPYTSASCLVDISNHSVEPVNLGRVSQGPYIDNGKIKLNYTSGDPCDVEGTKTVRFMETVIEFVCDRKSIDSKPKFLEQDGCTYYFDWHTVYACESEPPKPSVNCTIEDPLTGYLFNLSTLRNHGLFRYKKEGHQYYLSVCGNNDSNPCGDDSGMCEEELSGLKRHWSGGKSNSHLTYNNGIIFLNYSDGDPCHHCNFTRSTLIEFRCAHGLGEPKFLYKSHDCTYFFIWKTKFACQTQLHCGVDIGSVYYDLTSIADTFHLAASSILNDNASYYVSVCNSLPKLPEVSCPLGAAICRIQNNGSAESLGRDVYLPFVDFIGHATVVYINGSTCLKSLDFQNHARIIFLCDSEAGIGKPVLLTEGDECYFIFEWRTSLVCPVKAISDSKFTFCNYIDNSRSVYLNLLPLQKTGTKPYYEVADGNSSYFLNICSTPEISHFPNCKAAGVCKTEVNNVHNYGIAVSQKITYDGQRFKLTFNNGDDCPSDFKRKLASEVLFVCNPFVGKGEPVLHKKCTCMTVFLWETSLACQKLQEQGSFDIDRRHFNFNLISSLSNNWNISDNKNMTYYFNFCHGMQQTVNIFGCLPTVAVCMVDPNGLHLSLGMIKTMKMKSFNSTDLLLTFEYGDNRACFTVNSDDTLKPVTRIFMKCGTKLGQPVVFSGPDTKCFYDFVWETSLACTDLAVKVILEMDGLIKNPRFGYFFDIRNILNRTFITKGTSVSDQYVYKINLNGVFQNSSDSQNACSKAAICQIKLDTNIMRDIGSIDSRTFVMRGSELHLTFVSETQPCIKNSMKKVTTIISLRCVLSAGIGSPIFFYESNDCDYLFDWETSVVCPDFHKRNLHTKPTVTCPCNEEPPSHKAEIAMVIIFTLIILMVVAFILIKPARVVISSRFWRLLNTENLPYFRHKRDDIPTELR